MTDRQNPEIAEEDLFNILSDEELRARGFDGQVLEALREDSFQDHPDRAKGYLGILVANFLARHINAPAEQTPLVSAYLVAEVVGVPFEGLIKIERDGRKIIEENQLNGSPELYIHIGDAHICVPDSRATGLTAIAKLYATTKNQTYRTKLAVEAQPIVRIVAQRALRRLPSFIDLEDLVGEGNLGLLDAIERYDPSAGVRFETYSAQRILGAIMDSIRANDHLPRLDRTRWMEFTVFADKFEGTQGIVPSKEDMRAEWNRRGLPLQSFDHFYNDVWMRGGKMGSLDKDRTSDGKTGEQTYSLSDFVAAHRKDNPLVQAQNNDLMECFERDLHMIPRPYQEPLRRIIVDGITLAEAGAEAKPQFSESRMSQIVALYVKSGSFFQRTRAYFERPRSVKLKL